MATQRDLSDLREWVRDAVEPTLADGEDVVAATTARDNIPRYQTQLVVTTTRLITLTNRPLLDPVRTEYQLQKLTTVRTKNRDTQVRIIGEGGINKTFVMGPSNGEVLAMALQKQLGVA